MVNKDSLLGVRQQCQLLNLNRSRFYYRRIVSDDISIANTIAEIYQKYPVYGYRRITACLIRQGYRINGKCVLRLMRQMGLKAIYPGCKTTVRDKTHTKYPYALENLIITKPHQVWQIDITYLRTDQGFIYMNALIDMKTRYIVGWTLNNSLCEEACLRTLEKAIDDHGLPDIINADQGRQFTGEAWQKALQKQSILISHSAKGRSNDNAHIERLWRTLKYEWTIIHGARTVADYKRLLPEFIHWYNNLRPHQALGYLTPLEVLRKKPYEYNDKTNPLATLSIRPPSTITIANNSLIP